MNNVRVSIFGDICSDRGYRKLFEEETVENIFGDSLELIRNSDIAVANLECPLTDDLNPIEKTGQCLSGPPITAFKLSEAGFTAVCLGNNHIMDQGFQGLHETLRVCGEAGISAFGAGSCVSEARQHLIVEKNGMKIGFYSMAESEFSIAGANSPGANPISQENWCKDLLSLGKITDSFVVLLHAGKENYPLPPPKLQRICRNIASFGASLIVCQHSHCIGAIEKFENSFIVYGQGNYLFEQAGSRTLSWNTCSVIEMLLSKNGIEKIDFHYFEQNAISQTVKMLSDEKLKAVEGMQTEYNRLVLDAETVERRWQSIAKQEGPRMLLMLSGLSSILVKFCYRSGVYKLLYNRSSRLYALDLIRCQTHRELLEEYLSQSVFPGRPK